MGGSQIKRLQGLFRQLVRGPAAVRRRQANRLEEFLIALEPHRVYPYEFVYFRITGFRPKEDIRDTHTGRDLLPDLLRGLGALSASVPRAAQDLGEPVYTEEELRGKLGVCTRTLRRWRQRGLVAAPYRFPDGRAALVVRQKALDAFFARHPELAGRAKRFSRLSRQEEDRIRAAARRCVSEQGLSMTAAAGQIARELGRARETVRLALLRHDRERPDEAIFGAPTGRLTDQARRRICADYREGASVDTLCHRYRRSRASIYRVINQARAAELLQERFTCLRDEAFGAPDAETRILGDEFRAALLKADAPAAGPALQPTPASKGDEVALFRAFNYCRFRAAELQRRVNPHRYVPSQLLAEIEDLNARAESIRERLVRLHLPLAEQIARQHAAGPASPAKLLMPGRARLGALVESFDYRGRARFAAYAKLDLMKAFARAAADSGR